MVILLLAILLWSGEKPVITPVPQQVTLELLAARVNKSDEEWLDLLGRERYCVMRKKATELAFSGEYLHQQGEGIYHCAACNLPLFSSSAQYEAGNGWPSFSEPVLQKHVWIKEDFSLPFKRYEVLCRGCDSHLGHVFRKHKDSQLRYTINSIALKFTHKS